jgi:hypothetical protein
MVRREIRRKTIARSVLADGERTSMPLSRSAIDAFLFKRFAQIDTCHIVSVARDFPEHASWFTGGTLARVLDDGVPPGRAALAFVLLRRAHAAFHAWEQAAAAARALAESRTVAGYLATLRHLEACVAAAEHWHAYAREALGMQPFSPDDGSPQERLHVIYDAGRLRRRADRARAGDLHPVWFSDGGLHVRGKSLSFDDLRGMLVQIGHVVTAISRAPANAVVAVATPEGAGDGRRRRSAGPRRRRAAASIRAAAPPARRSVSPGAGARRPERRPRPARRTDPGAHRRDRR